jgi:hypothetical protein
MTRAKDGTFYIAEQENGDKHLAGTPTASGRRRIS